MGTMTSEERERMNEICAQMQVEQDHRKFGLLLAELNDLLERKGHRLEADSIVKPSKE